MTSLNFVDQYVIQKVVTSDKTFKSDVAPSDTDNDFEPSDYSATDYFDSENEAPLPNLVKCNSNNNKNYKLNSLLGNKKRETHR